MASTMMVCSRTGMARHSVQPESHIRQHQRMHKSAHQLRSAMNTISISMKPGPVLPNLQRCELEPTSLTRLAEPLSLTPSRSHLSNRTKQPIDSSSTDGQQLLLHPIVQTQMPCRSMASINDGRELQPFYRNPVGCFPQNNQCFSRFQVGSVPNPFALDG